MLRFEPWKIVLVCVISLLGILYAAPNFIGGDDATEVSSGWLPSKQVHLGLDLQGGVHLLIEVEVESVVGQVMDNLVEEVRPRLRGERIGYTSLGRQGERVSFKLREPEQAEAAIALLADIDPDTVIDSDGAGIVTISMTEAKALERRRDAINRTIEVIRKRIDELGTTEPTIQRQGDSRIIVQVPGFDDPERLKELIGKTAKLEIRMVDEATAVSDAVGGRVPPGSELLYEADEQNSEAAGTPIVLRKKVLLDGDHLTMAAATTDQYNRPAVAIRFNAAGGRIFAKVTTENVGRRFAIVLDDEVISAPVIQEPIPGGNGQITGNFSIATANDLALLLRAGALPAPLTYAEERTVGPSLGADSIAAGKIASIVGLVLVIAYMILSYGLFGIASTVALTINIALILAVLSVLQATLTLPGIAGIVLTIGMAVDANVLIFERIREEVRNGRTPFSAVDIGFQQALRTIIDANVTTLIAAILLFQFGSGPVKGFAVTLGIGIFTSVFSAIMVTRLLIILWLRRTRPQTLPI